MSNAFWKLKEKTNSTFTIIKDIAYISSMLTIAINVEWLFLNPIWFLFIILQLLRKLSNMWYISFSSNFENSGDREIGL